MELFGELLVGVSLDGEGLVDGQDFEEEGQLGAIFGSDRLGEEELVLGAEIEEGSAGGEIFGGVGGVSAHP